MAADKIGHRLPRTLLLSGLALGFELLLGLLVGIVAALRKQTWVDSVAMATAFAPTARAMWRAIRSPTS